MRIALGFGVALACCACSAESGVRPRNPVNASMTEPTCVAAPALQDSFPKAFAAAQDYDAYHAERAPNIDLGHIGDSRIGTEPNPPHIDPPWEQPFTLDRPYAGRRACPVVYVVPVVPVISE
ncbi:MAG TPA: hypothetical protein VF765_37845 [Polyangiaceae bacterium]